MSFSLVHCIKESNFDFSWQGKRIQDRLKAAEYFDCSARSGEGVLEVFREVAYQGLLRQLQPRRSRSFWGFTKRSLRGSIKSIQ